MAVLDPRLIPLIETLVDADLDWLAFEITEGVRRGVESEETAETLEMARADAQEKRPPPERVILDAQPVTASPLLGDDQIDWAGRYVVARIDDSLAALAASLDNLDALLGTSDIEPAKAGLPERPVLVLGESDEAKKVDRGAAERAGEGLGALRAALERWSLATRTAMQS